MDNLIEEFRAAVRSNALAAKAIKGPLQCLFDDYVRHRDAVTRPAPKPGPGLQPLPIGLTFLDPYIPKPDKPLTYICVAVHVFLNAQGGGFVYNDGTGDKPLNETSASVFKTVFDWVNGYYTYNVPPSDTPVCTAAPPPPQGRDSRIRFILRHVKFYRDDALHNSGSWDPNVWVPMASQGDSHFDDTINIFLSHPASGGGFYAMPPTSDPNYNQYIVGFGFGGLWQSAQLIAHELGHILGLRHTYVGGGASAVCSESDPFFLRDIFGCGANNTCPHSSGWNLDPYDPSINATNNLLGGTAAMGWISTLQIAYAHYNLQTMASLQKYQEHNCHCIKCCAFGAKIADHVSNGPDIALRYDQTLANTGWAWNGEHFVAPCDGTYQFGITFQKDAYYDGGTSDDVWVALMWQRPSGVQEVGRAWSGEPAPRSTGAFTNILAMKKNDVVWTVLHSDGDARRHICDLHFSGHMVCCDCL